MHNSQQKETVFSINTGSSRGGSIGGGGGGGNQRTHSPHCRVTCTQLIDCRVLSYVHFNIIINHNSILAPYYEIVRESNKICTYMYVHVCATHTLMHVLHIHVHVRSCMCNPPTHACFEVRVKINRM